MCSISNVSKENMVVFAVGLSVSDLPAVVGSKLGSLSGELVGYCPSGQAGDVTLSQESVAPTVSVPRRCLLNMSGNESMFIQLLAVSLPQLN